MLTLKQKQAKMANFSISAILQTNDGGASKYASIRGSKYR